jgi:GNAT superfamily N-acetyltransferase
MVTIKNATQVDILSLALLMYDLGYPATEIEMQTRFDHISGHEDYRMLVAVTENNEVAGMIGLIKNYYFEHNGLYIRVGAMVVGKDFRNMGIGKKLMMEAENWAAEIGANSILLNSGNREERKAAHVFYQKIGYEIQSSGFVKYLS